MTFPDTFYWTKTIMFWLIFSWNMFMWVLLTIIQQRFGKWPCYQLTHYCVGIMGAVASQITNLTIVYLTVYSDADQRKHQSSASLAFVRGIHRRPVNSPRKWPVTRKMFPFDDVIMKSMIKLVLTWYSVHIPRSVDAPLGKWLSSSTLGQIGPHYPDDIFICILVSEKF